MNYPKISIVTPSYNQGQYLEDTILSVLGQRYPNLEYMIYDAESTDNTVEIIKRYETKLAYWVSEKDKGQADAINKGFANSTGEILMWLNSDDILMPNVLQFIADQYKLKGDGIFYGNCIHFNELPNGEVRCSGSDVRKAFKKIPLELADTIIQPSSFWSKKVWLENGILDEKFHFGFDWEWFLRAKKNNITFYSIDKVISLYRFHDEHKTGVGGSERHEELFKIYQLYSPYYGRLYQMIKEENVTLNLFEKKLFWFFKFIYGRGVNEIHFFKLKKYVKYKNYKASEIEIILNML